MLYLRVDIAKQVDIISGYWISVRMFRVHRDQVPDSVRHQGRVGVKMLKITLSERSVSM